MELELATSTYEYDQIADEHSVLDDLTAEIHSTADTHDDCLMRCLRMQLKKKLLDFDERGVLFSFVVQFLRHFCYGNSDGFTATQKWIRDDPSIGGFQSTNFRSTSEEPLDVNGTRPDYVTCGRTNTTALQVWINGIIKWIKCFTEIDCEWLREKLFVMHKSIRELIGIARLFHDSERRWLIQ